MSLLISEENNPDGDVRQLAGSLAFYASIAMSLMIFFAVSKLKENPEFQNRVNKNPFKGIQRCMDKPTCKNINNSSIYRKFRWGSYRSTHPLCDSIYS